MSGTFNQLDVPPTLVSFAVDVAKYPDVITPELKKAGNKLVLFEIYKDEYDIPVYKDVMHMYDQINTLMKEKKIVSAYALDAKGVAVAAAKMGFGNGLGLSVNDDVAAEDLFKNQLGGLLVEMAEEDIAGLDELEAEYKVIGTVTEGDFIFGGTVLSQKEALEAWKKPLEKVFPTKALKDTDKVDSGIYCADSIHICKNKVAKPTVFIPVFPGTNCEYDSARAFIRAGANVVTKVFKNLTAEDIRDSVEEFEKAIAQAQIIMFPGGF